MARATFFKKGDIAIYLAATILFVALLVAFVFPNNADADGIEIIDFSGDNVLLASYSISTDELTVFSDRVSYIKTADGYVVTVKTADGENVLEIKGGAAVMLSADCSNSADCTKFKGIEGQGDEIICLPRKILIRGTGESDRLVIG